MYILYILDIVKCQPCFLNLDFSCFFHYVGTMVLQIKKILFSATKDLLERIDDFRFENRIESRSEAMRRLLDEALRKYEKKTKN